MSVNWNKGRTTQKYLVYSKKPKIGLFLKNTGFLELKTYYFFLENNGKGLRILLDE